VTSPTRLAVVVPLYNGGSFLKQTLDSLAAQTVPLSEVIVVDDGSVDGGAEIAADHPLSPRVLRQDNAGVAVARNRGALAAQADYIAFLDQDDLWLPGRHARLCSFLDANPDCRAFATTEQSFFLERDRGALERLHEGLHKVADHPDVRDVAALLSGSKPVEGPPAVARTVQTRDLLRAPITLTTSYVFERERFLVTGGCATFARSMDDYWTLLNMSRLAPIPVVDEPSVLYRIHPSSTTMSTTWPMPLLTSLAAARFGGNLVPSGHARDPSYVPPVTAFMRHQLFALARSGGLGVVDGVALTQLLATTRGEQLRITLRLAQAGSKAWLRRRLLRAGR